MSHANCSGKTLRVWHYGSGPLYPLLVLLAVGLAVAPGTAGAANTITVNTLTDETTSGDGLCSLREAINNANSKSQLSTDCAPGTGADAIVFSVSGTITLSGALPAIANTLKIDGGGRVAIDGANYYRVLVVNGALEVDNLTIEHGAAFGPPVTQGGGIYNTGTLTISNGTFSGNYAYEGAGISNEGGTLTVTNGTFSGNSSVDTGGGISNDGGTLTVSNSTFSNNHSFVVGGGIYNTGTLTITNNTFSGNGSSGYGGGIYNTGTLSVANTTLSGNSASDDGGGIFNENGTVTLANSTFFGNIAIFQGGSISNGGTLTASNITISGNSAIYGGGIYNSSSTVTVSNSIIAGNTSYGSTNCSGEALNNGGYNISDDGSCGFGTSTGANGQTLGDNVNPLLDPNGLQNNGGPTQTIALQSTSPAVDAIPVADCPATDQRGVTRPDSGESVCDVGAFEFEDTVPFASFTAKLDLRPSAGSFDLKASFILGAGSTGINPLNQAVMLQIGSYSVTVPAGSFNKNKKGAYVFEGTINGVSLQIRIKPQGGGAYSFQAEGTGANLTGISNPVSVTLSIGNNSGSISVTADFS